jgi:hypothetical protein
LRVAMNGARLAVRAGGGIGSETLARSWTALVQRSYPTPPGRERQGKPDDRAHSRVAAAVGACRPVRNLSGRQIFASTFRLGQTPYNRAGCAQVLYLGTLPPRAPGLLVSPGAGAWPRKAFITPARPGRLSCFRGTSIPRWSWKRRAPLAPASRLRSSAGWES